MEVTPLSTAGDDPCSSLVDRREVRIEVWDVASRRELDPAAGHRRLLVAVAGEGVNVSHGDQAPPTHLRRFETHTVEGAWPIRLESGAEPSRVIVVTRPNEAGGASVQALPLGTRGLREELETARALLFVPSGALVARLTGEEEPYELEAGDALWLRDVKDGDEVALEGTCADCGVVLVGVDAPPA